VVRTRISQRNFVEARRLVEQNKNELTVLESMDAGKTITDCLHEGVASFAGMRSLRTRYLGKLHQQAMMHLR
jgi:hypothetical protein